MNYYKEIKDTLVKNEIYKRAKDYSKNKNDLKSYFEVGKLLVEAQGGEHRAQYGNELIKEYSKKLTQELGKGYSTRNLRNMRSFYIKFQKWQALPAKLTWSHYLELIKVDDEQAISYYIYLSETQNLSYRQLNEKIKSNEYERIGKKSELEEPKINTLIKNPIIIKTKQIPEKLTEYILHNMILEDMEHFLKELGLGFSFIGSEVKINIDGVTHSMDYLLYNYEFNCFVVVELKVGKEKADHIGQVLKYINYVDKNIKKTFHNKTIGIIVCRKENKFVVEYASDYRIFSTTYQLITN